MRMSVSTLSKLLKLDRPSIAKSIFVSTLFSILARVSGLLKEATLALYLGVSVVMDSYVLLLMVATFAVAPSAGAISTPLTRQLTNTDGGVKPEDVTRYALPILSLTLLSVGLLTAIIFIAFSRLSLTALADEDYLLTLGLFLLPICFFSASTTIANSILSARRQFYFISAIPLIVPLTIIAACIFSSESYIAEALFLGTMFGYLLETLFTLAKVKLPINRALIPSWNRLKNAAHLLAQWPLMAASSLIMSGCLILDQVMASIAGPGSVAIISFGNKVSLGLISLSAILWTVLLPEFVSQAKQLKFFELKRTLITSLAATFCLGMLICISLAQFSELIIYLLYERGEFSPEDTSIVADVQFYYLLHVPLYACVLICARVVNSFEKSAIFLAGNLVTLILNLCLNLIFLKMYGVVGIAMATFYSYSVMVILWLCGALAVIRNEQKHSA